MKKLETFPFVRKARMSWWCKIHKNAWAKTLLKNLTGKSNKLIKNNETYFTLYPVYFLVHIHEKDSCSGYQN